MERHYYEYPPSQAAIHNIPNRDFGSVTPAKAKKSWADLLRFKKSKGRYLSPVVPALPCPQPVSFVPAPGHNYLQEYRQKYGGYSNYGPSTFQASQFPTPFDVSTTKHCHAVHSISAKTGRTIASTVRYTDWFGSVVQHKTPTRPSMPLFAPPPGYPIEKPAPWDNYVAMDPVYDAPQLVPLNVYTNVCMCPEQLRQTRGRKKRKCKVCGRKVGTLRYNTTGSVAARVRPSLSPYMMQTPPPTSPHGWGWQMLEQRVYQECQMQRRAHSQSPARMLSDDESPPPTPETVRSFHSIKSTDSSTTVICCSSAENSRFESAKRPGKWDDKNSILADNTTAYELISRYSRKDRDVSPDTDDLSDVDPWDATEVDSEGKGSDTVRVIVIGGEQLKQPKHIRVKNTRQTLEKIPELTNSYSVKKTLAARSDVQTGNKSATNTVSSVRIAGQKMLVLSKVPFASKLTTFSSDEFTADEPSDYPMSNNCSDSDATPDVEELPFDRLRIDDSLQVDSECDKTIDNLPPTSTAGEGRGDDSSVFSSLLSSPEHSCSSPSTLSDLLNVKSILKQPSSLDTSSEADSSDFYSPTPAEIKPSNRKKKQVQFTPSADVPLLEDKENVGNVSCNLDQLYTKETFSSSFIQSLHEIYERHTSQSANNSLCRLNTDLNDIAYYGASNSEDIFQDDDQLINCDPNENKKPEVVIEIGHDGHWSLDQISPDKLPQHKSTEDVIEIDNDNQNQPQNESPSQVFISNHKRALTRKSHVTHKPATSPIRPNVPPPPPPSKASHAHRPLPSPPSMSSTLSPPPSPPPPLPSSPQPILDQSHFVESNSHEYPPSFSSFKTESSFMKSSPSLQPIYESDIREVLPSAGLLPLFGNEQEARTATIRGRLGPTVRPFCPPNLPLTSEVADVPVAPRRRNRQNSTSPENMVSATNKNSTATGRKNKSSFLSSLVGDEDPYEQITDHIYEELNSIPDSNNLNPPSPGKSMFLGASKYEILEYLQDARKRVSFSNENEEYMKIIQNDQTQLADLEDEELDQLLGLDPPEHDDQFLVLTSRNRGPRSSNMSSNSDSSSENSGTILLRTDKERLSAGEIERTDSGVGSETSKPNLIRKRYNGKTSELKDNNNIVLCDDCDASVDTHITNSGVMYAPLVCRRCSRRRQERKEILTEIMETEIKYGRDLKVMVEEFYRPMLVAGLLHRDQLSGIFLNVEELMEFNRQFCLQLRDTFEIALDQGDEDLLTVNVAKLFLQASPMLNAFEGYCIRQGGASLLLQSLEKEKELLRIFLKVSQMENTLLRRMNLHSFLMVPVQRVTKYPLLLSRLHKSTPSSHSSREDCRHAKEKIEIHLQHMNDETKETSPTKLWRRISMSMGNGVSKRSFSQTPDYAVNLKFRKFALNILDWNAEESTIVKEGSLLCLLPDANNWTRRGRSMKMINVHALLITLGAPNTHFEEEELPEEGLIKPHDMGLKEVALVAFKENKMSKQALVKHEPFLLSRCVVTFDSEGETETFEVTDFNDKDLFIFKGNDYKTTNSWFRHIQFYGLSVGSWKKRRPALANIMINGMHRS